MRNVLAHNFENLLHLKAIVDAGSINRASQAIGLSQPALTRSIGRLEATLGVKLLTRVPKGVYPTEFCRMLLEHVAAADVELEHAETALRVMKARSGSQLTCGGTFVPMSYLVPLAVKGFSEAKPASHVRLVEGATDDLLRMLRLGELEVVICPKMDAQRDDDLIAEALAIERVGIFADIGNPLLNEKEHHLEDLAAKAKWIIPDRTGQLRRLLTDQFARHSVEAPKHFIESSSLAASRRLIGVTGRIAFSTSLLLAPDLLAGTTKEVHGDWQFPTTTISLFRRNEKLSPAALLFVDCLRKAARTLPPPEMA
jgi:LysR family transcriptional regulator of gallate degradation